MVLNLLGPFPVSGTALLCRAVPVKTGAGHEEQLLGSAERGGACEPITYWWGPVLPASVPWTAGHQLLLSACWWLSGKHGLHMWGLLLGWRDDHSLFPSTLATLSCYYLISLSFSFTSSSRYLHPSLGPQQNQQEQTQLFRAVLLLSLLSQLVSQFCSRKRTLSQQENSAGVWIWAASLGWEQQLLQGEGGVVSVSNLPKAHKVLSLKKWEWRG